VRGWPSGSLAARGHADHLAGAEPVGRIGALAIDPDLPGAGPAADRGKADLRQVALEPAVQPHAIVIGADGELADAIGGNGAARGHAMLLARASPASRPAIPPITETAA
jgi:hypothetical protein